MFMLGGGVNQYVNPKITEGPKLRATPHALQMKDYDYRSSSASRVWFGRMFLPPNDAISETHRGMTFGRLREVSIAGIRSNRSTIIQPRHDEVGCSTNLISRELAIS